MGDVNDTTDLYECPACGYEAENKQELQDHFQEKEADQAHQEYNINPQSAEVLDENSIGAPAGTPGHPGIDEGTEE